MTIKTIRRKPSRTKWAAKDASGTVWEYWRKPDLVYMWGWASPGSGIRSPLKISGPWQDSLRRIIDKPKGKK